MKRLLIVVIASACVFSTQTLRADVMPSTPGTIPVVQANDPPITYTQQAEVTGTIGGRSFTNALITLMLTSDTAFVTGGAGFFSNTTGPFTLSIAGIGSGSFTDSMQVFDNQTFSPPAAGFGDLTAGGSVLDTFSAVFASYDLTTAIGPISGNPFIRPDLSFGTTLGLLNIQSANNASFTATTVPEPSSYLLFGTVLFGVLHSLRRKAK